MKRAPGLGNRILESIEWRVGFRVLRVIRRDMTRSVAPAGDDVSFAALDRPQAMAFAQPAFDLRPAWVDEAFKRPGGCVGAFREGRPVGYAWYALEAAPDLHGLWVRVPPDAAYRYKIFVLPEFRNLHVARRLSVFADGVCVERGRVTSLSLIAIHNAASLASATSIGGEVAGYIAHWCLSGRHLLLWHSPGTRRSGLRLVRGAPAQ